MNEQYIRDLHILERNGFVERAKGSDVYMTEYYEGVRALVYRTGSKRWGVRFAVAVATTGVHAAAPVWTHLECGVYDTISEVLQNVGQNAMALNAIKSSKEA